MAETKRLLNARSSKRATAGSNPALSANFVSNSSQKNQKRKTNKNKWLGVMSLASSLSISRFIPENNDICSRFVVRNVVRENLVA